MASFANFLRWVARFLKRLSSSARAVEDARYEVERKYRLSPEEFQPLQAKLRRLGFSRQAQARLTDTMMPPRQPGDLMRVRDEVCDGKRTSFLTTKRWVELGNGERERQERECQLDDIARECLLDLGSRLGEELLSYSKERTTYSGRRSGRRVTVVFDLAEGLGKYSGHYFEVEIVTASEDDVPQCRQLIESLVLELLNGEKRELAPSYGEMLRLSRQES